MRGAEGVATVRPGRASDSAWSEGLNNYIRNVEVGGSSALTSN